MMPKVLSNKFCFGNKMHHVPFTFIPVLLLQLFLLRSIGHVHLAVYIGKIKITGFHFSVIPLDIMRTQISLMVAGCMWE